MMIVRKTQPSDMEACFAVRASTRDNPISREQLAAVGITPAALTADLEAGRMVGWVCEDAGHVVAFCSGDARTGEVLVLAVLPEYEGQGIGRRLLGEVVRELRERGHGRVWLAASANPADRSHGFYRALGWRQTGEIDAIGDEILVLDPG